MLTVGGASVAVPVSQADGLRPASAAAPSVAPAARPGSLGVVAKRAPRRSTPLDVSATSVRTTRSPRPAALAQASAASPPAVVPVAAPAAGATQAAVAEREQTDSAPTSPGLVATAVAGRAEQPVAVPVPPVLVPCRCPSRRPCHSRSRCRNAAPRFPRSSRRRPARRAPLGRARRRCRFPHRLSPCRRCCLRKRPGACSS